MRKYATTILTLLAMSFFHSAAAWAGSPTFTKKPAVHKVADKYTIAFTVAAPTDVEVAVLSGSNVVRSLAAGVLGGTTAPPEPLQPGLAQSLVWDGKGDWGLPVGKGPFTVRVRLGMGVKLGRIVGDSPYNFYEMNGSGLAVDQKNGDLYCMMKRGRDAHSFCLRVYDRAGNYLHEIMPYPAGIDAASLAAFGSLPLAEPGRFAPLNRNSLWPVFYPLNVNGGVGVKLMGIAPGTSDTLLLLDEYFSTIWRIRMRDGGAGTPFAEALWDAGKAPGGYGRVGGVIGTSSPDGKYCYFTSYCSTAPKGQKVNSAWPEGRIYRMEPGKGKTTTFADIVLPADWAPAGEPWATPANGFQALCGIAVDKDGHVLVCDAASGKVRNFSPDGKETGVIDAPGAYSLAPDFKTGALYVLTRSAWRERKLGVNAVVKYESSKPGANVVAKLELKRGGTVLAGDFSGPTPQLWLTDGAAPYTPEIPRFNLFRIEEKNGTLMVAENLAERGKTAAGFAVRMDVDPETDLVYINNGWGETRRYNGLTGEYAGKLSQNGEPEMILGSELCVRRDGMVYVSGGDGYSGPWSRFNRDLSPAPLADGRKQFADRYGKMGGGYYGNPGSCVTPDGHLYFNSMFGFRINAVFEVNPDGSLGRCPRLTDVLTVKPAAGGFKGALIGPLQDQSGGIEIDQKGCLYVGLHLQAQGYELPKDLAKIAGIGSVIKFGPDGGALLPSPEAVKPGTKYENYKNDPLTMPAKVGPGLTAISPDGWAPGGGGKKWLEGAIKTYPLLGPFSHAEGCSCQSPRFDVDDYGRLYIPNAYTCSVRVLDNEGNEILTFGNYGNVDSQGPEIPLAYPVAAKASFRHIYVADSANRRVVRVDPTWAAEEACEIK